MRRRPNYSASNKKKVRPVGWGFNNRQGAKRIKALVEKHHPWAMTFWEAVGYRVDERIVRRVRTL